MRLEPSTFIYLCFPLLISLSHILCLLFLPMFLPLICDPSVVL